MVLSALKSLTSLVTILVQIILGIYIYVYVIYIYIYIILKDCIVKSPECSNCEQWAMHSANSERPKRDSPPNSKCTQAVGKMYENVPSRLLP